MSPQSQTLGKGASKNRKPKMAGKTARIGGASSESLSVEEIIASLNLLDAEMAERKPRRGSSKWKFLKRRLVALERGKDDLKGRTRSEAEDTKKKTKAMEKAEEDNARHREMNAAGKEKNRVLNAVINLLAPALLSDSRPEGEEEGEGEGGPNFSGQ